MKGSDASNIWDEEVAAHEMEFSDDEEEAEYRRRLKAECVLPPAACSLFFLLKKADYECTSSRRSRTQSATPGPSGAGRNARQSATPAPHQPSPVPTSLLPARPSVSYADALEPSSFVTPSLPSAAPMSAAASAPPSSSNRAAFGDKPPPGRVGRRMFERDTGANLAPGEEVEFEFSSGEGSDSAEEGEERPGLTGFGRGGSTRGGGGRGGAGSSQRGGQRERGRGRGRGRGEAPRGRGGRNVAPLPSRAGPSGGSPAGLPSRPSFDTDFGPDAGVDGPVRMSAGSATTPTAPDSSSTFTFGTAAVPQTDFRFQPATGSPKQALSPSAPSPVAPAPRGADSASSSPYQQPRQQPWATNGASSRPTPPMADAQGAAAYGYRPEAYGGMQHHAQQHPYYPQAPAAGAYGAYNPAAAYPAEGSGSNAGCYSPHAPSWNADTAYRGGAPPVADPRGGHINPRFLPASQGQAFGQPSQQPPMGGQGAAGWYANPAAYGAPPPPGGGPGGNGWW